MTNDKDCLLIKRYASRRLYNTETSEYITLKQVAEIIQSGRNIKIEDYNSGADVTRQYLVQIIAEQEASSDDVLPIDVLIEMVRMYNSSNPYQYLEFLETSLKAFRESQTQILESMKTYADPLAAIEEYHTKQRELFSAMIGSWKTDPKHRPSANVKKD